MYRLIRSREMSQVPITPFASAKLVLAQCKKKSDIFILHVNSPMKYLISHYLGITDEHRKSAYCSMYIYSYMLIIPPRDIKKEAIIDKWKNTRLYRNYCNEKQELFLSVLQILLDCMEPNNDDDTSYSGKYHNIRCMLLLYNGNMKNLYDLSNYGGDFSAFAQYSLEEVRPTQQYHTQPYSSRDKKYQYPKYHSTQNH